MIKISASTAAPSSVIGQGVSDIERDIIERMAASNAVYDFDSLDQLTFEMKMRMNIIAAAKALYNSGAEFCKSPQECNPDYWKLTQGMGVQRDGFKLRQDVKPSNALTDLFENGSEYAFECATAPAIVFYKAVLDLLGEVVFNDLFTKIYLTTVNWGSGVRDLKTTWQKEPDYFPGDRRYFSNPAVDYPDKSEWKGENVIDLGDGTYYGHGIYGFLTAQELIEKLNSHRRKGAEQSAYLEDKAGRPDFKYLAQYAPQDDNNREESELMDKKTK